MTDNKLLRIAIDGPGGAGKSTIAKLVAKELNIDYVDTGAMYRAIALKIIKSGTPCEEGEELQKMLDDTDILFSGGKVYLDGEDVSGEIRTQEVSMMASDSSAFPMVRAKLTAMQQEMGRTKSVVMDGRDISTIVMPDAEFKFFITASPEERANRRFLELKAKGENPDYEKVLQEINERDYNDSHREIAPLKPAEDSVIIDTTSMSIEEVLAEVIGIIEGGEANSQSLE